MVAHNEEYHLENCLRTLEFANEIVVVLDKCTDKSKKIALKYADKIIEGSWDIEGQRRNIALDNCRGQWVLELDADERISKELQEEILININNNKNCNFETKINNHIGKRSINNGWLRSMAVQKRQFINYNGNKKYIEDRSLHPTAELKGEIKSLTNPIIHYMDNDISDFINRFNRYTSLRANDLANSGKKIKRRKLLPLFFSFLNRLFKAFIINKGYKEGGLGLLVSFFSSSYNLVAYLKAIEIVYSSKNKE